MMRTTDVDFRVGDRLRMIECKDPYAPIMPGEKGTVVLVDSLGTAHMEWDNGRTLGVIPEEDEVEIIPLDKEYDGLDSLCAAECSDENAFEAHQEKSHGAIGLMESTALDSGGAWAVRITFLDPANRDKAPEYAFVEADGLRALLDGADVKNGVDTGFHKAGRHRSFVMIAHGTRYASQKGDAHVREAFECRLLKSGVADDYRERMESAGWDGRGEGPEKMFFSPNDQRPLLLKECQNALEKDVRRSRDMER